MRNSAKARIQWTTTVVLLVGLITIWVFTLFPQVVSSVYSYSIFVGIAATLRTITGIVSFSLGDILYILVVVLALRAIFNFIRAVFSRTLTGKAVVRSVIRFVNFFLFGLLFFRIAWGINYARPETSTELGIADSTYTTQQLTQLAGFFILKLAAIKPDRDQYYSVYLLEKRAKESFLSLSKKQKAFYYPAAEVKSALNSWIITKIGLEGYYNPFTGEAHINTRLPQFTLPFVTCHEIAHQLGIAREDEANLIGYLACINSADPNFRYAGNYAMLRYILFELSYKSPEAFEKIKGLLPPQVRDDLRTEQSFWQENNNGMFAYMDMALDHFLKLNNQPSGIQSYQRIVLWMYNFYKKDLVRMNAVSEVAGMTSTLHNSP